MNATIWNNLIGKHILVAEADNQTTTYEVTVEAVSDNGKFAKFLYHGTGAEIYEATQDFNFIKEQNE